MIDLIRAFRTDGRFVRRLFGFVPSLVIAEIFYRLHTFTIECLAFLLTWLVLDVLIESVLRTYQMIRPFGGIGSARRLNQRAES
jgi:hypothetical protein